MPFWRAVLGYTPRIDSPDEDLVDPHDRDAGFWFEQMDEPRPDGKGAIHVAIWVPLEQAASRIEAALAAGGRIVHEANAPAWWILAIRDEEGQGSEALDDLSRAFGPEKPCRSSWRTSPVVKTASPDSNASRNRSTAGAFGG